MPTQLPPTLDAVAAARWAKVWQPESPWLHEEVARRMEERLQWMAAKPARWVHWEPVRGGLKAQALLEARYPKSQCFMLQALEEHASAATKLIAKPWWKSKLWSGPQVHWVAPQTPVELVWANMALHMVADPQALIARWHSLLATDGFLMFSCLGPDTLAQLRRVYAEAGWPAPAHEFTDMHDWGDMLVAGGFAQPVMDMERITLSFSSPESLLAELRALGRNLNLRRFAGLRGRGWHTRLKDALRSGLAVPADPASGPADVARRLSLTFEVVYGHAFKAKARMPVAPQTAISLDEMRSVLRQPRG